MEAGVNDSDVASDVDAGWFERLFVMFENYMERSFDRQQKNRTNV